MIKNCVENRYSYLSDYDIRYIRNIAVYDLGKAGISSLIHKNVDTVENILLGKIRRKAGGKIYSREDFKNFQKYGKGRRIYNRPIKRETDFSVCYFLRLLKAKSVEELVDVFKCGKDFFYLDK